MKIITGATGTAHVQAEDDRAMNYGLSGRDGILLSDGFEWTDKKVYNAKFGLLAAKHPSTNTVVIYEGDYILQGCQGRINYGESETFDIEPGTAGYNRVDYIVVHYHRDELGVESMNLELIKGTPTPTGSTIALPTIPAGDIYKGDMDAYGKLYAIQLKGTDVSIVRRAPYLLSSEAISDVLSALYSINQTISGISGSISSEATSAAANITIKDSLGTHLDPNVTLQAVGNSLLQICDALKLLTGLVNNINSNTYSWDPPVMTLF